jgi:hypothetical protein
MAAPVATFTYQSLNSEEGDSFRLLSLVPGDDDSPVECRLIHTRRGFQYHPYEALSYAWGEPTLSSEIIVNGLLFPITHNLEQALRSLRDKDGGSARTLWVDAICINQSHVSERNHQVAQMGEIYAAATKVIIWLGASSADSDVGIGFMHLVHERLSQNGEFSVKTVQSGKYPESVFEIALKEFLGPEWYHGWEAGARLLSRTWWQRAWVVQELVVAKDAVCYCGKTSIPWSEMDAFIATLGHSRKMIIGKKSHSFVASGAADTAFRISYMRNKFRSKGPIHLWKLLKPLHRQHCADPRDKVYSVLGMTHPKIRQNLKPDYAKSLSQVFTLAVVADILDGGDLDALLLVDHGDTPPGDVLPSWVADFGAKISGYRTTINKPRESCTIKFSEDFRVMHTNGFKCDEVVEITVQETKRPFQAQSSDYDKWSWNIARLTAKLVEEGGIRNVIRKHINTPEDLRRSVEEVIYDVLITGQLSTYTGWIKHDVRYPDEDANEITRASKGLSKNTKLGQQPGDHRQSHPISESMNSNREDTTDQACLKPLDWKELLQGAVRTTRERTMMLSSKRYLGLVPMATEPGDHIFVLHGLLDPAILRPQSDGTFKFIGVAYVHGIMNKEWQEDFEQGLYKEMRVSIR